MYTKLSFFFACHLQFFHVFDVQNPKRESPNFTCFVVIFVHSDFEIETFASNTGTQYHQSTSINYVSDTYDFIHFLHFLCFRWFRLSPLRDALFCSALASSPSVILLADQRSSKLKMEARTVLCRRIRRVSLRVRTCL